MNRIKISILTPSYNQGNFIERNILSVLNQNYPLFEHIIMDGGSTDNTVEILKKYPHIKWVSEKDNGQADALNKGLKISTGEIIGWLNSDDFYEPYIFDDVAIEFEDKKVNWIISDIKIFYEETKHEIQIKSPIVTFRNLLRNPDIVKQPGAFFRKSILEQAGAWDTKLHMVMDYDLWLRLSKISMPKMVHKYLACFTAQAEQKSNGYNIPIQLKEMSRVMSREGAPLYYHLKIIVKKYLYFVKFHLKLVLINIGMISPKYRQRHYFNRNKY